MSEAVLIQDVYSLFGTSDKHRKPYGTKGEKVKIISVHEDVLIVEGKSGSRFAVTIEEIFQNQKK